MARRIWQLSYRAVHLVREEVWHDVKFGVAAVLLATLVGSTAFGLPWDRFVLANIIGFAAIPAASFLYHFTRVLHRPHRSSSWRQRPSAFIPATGNQAPGLLQFGVDPLKPTYVGRNRCEVTDPTGSIWLEQQPNDSPVPQLTRGLQVFYPESFPGAPPVQDGTYSVRWLLGVGRHRWREILRYSFEVRLP